MAAPAIPTLADIEAAAARLKGHIAATPLIPAPKMGAKLGAKLFIKAETAQQTGSFKFRGALNALMQLNPDERKAGVVAFSSGNHAQGVAAAAKLLGIRATIVMPSDAPAVKVENTRGYGATVVPYDRYTESREEIAARIAGESGASTIPPFDDPRIVAGQGTIGLEIIRQAKELGVTPDIVVAPCSGGGLIGGIALVFAALSPATKIYAAEPEAFDDMRKSLAAGERRGHDNNARSICDALLSPMPGVLPFAIARKYLAGSLPASDDEVRRAMAAAYNELKLTVEPGGAAALAALLAGRLNVTGKTVVVVASGGNVDRGIFDAALAANKDA